MKKNKLIKAVKPFLKWAGGKGQLISTFEDYYPKRLKEGKIKKYIEPFIGGGAVFFELVQKYHFTEIILNDLNEELILTYMVVQRDVQKLIDALYSIEAEYHNLDSDEQSSYYYKYRKMFNEEKKSVNYNNYNLEWILHVAKLIYLNRTCFNGLYRLNQKGEFNVPFGRYKKPKICDEKNLIASNLILQGVQFYMEDFEKLTSLIDKYSFVYIDPPYRPISKTASFTSYSKYEFNDDSQRRLAGWFRVLDKKGAAVMLSNSDPQNNNPQDNFFYDLYEGFFIKKVPASRFINANPAGRGIVNELIIRNEE